MVQIDYLPYWILVGVTIWFLGLFALAAVVLAARSDEADARRRERKVVRKPRAAKVVESSTDQTVLPLSPVSARKQAP